MRLFDFGRKAKLTKAMAVKEPPTLAGFQFSLKGSPRHYDDVKLIVERGGKAKVYFGEPLAYERGAGVALWRIRAADLAWLSDLYDWWANMERVEPMQFTFHLYLPDDPKYPVLDLRQHRPSDVEAFIRERAPWRDRRLPGQTAQLSSGQPSLSSH